MQSRVTVNVDEWLQDVDNLSVQDMQRSASALSVRTDASGAGEAPSSDSLYDSDFDVGSEVTPMERPDSVELVRDEETDRQDAAEVDGEWAMVEQERQRLEQLTAGWDDPTQVDWGHTEEESFTQATAATVGSDTDADSLQQQTPGAAPDTPGMDIVLSYKCIALYNYTFGSSTRQVETRIDGEIETVSKYKRSLTLFMFGASFPVQQEDTRIWLPYV
uniref:Uncharacterized protein n=1 Tax=Timema shepardi TaxID=629360 RepID=A0A7R9FZV8_TIMSH|nr:unnamed protein product [Timema shepardi]